MPKARLDQALVERGLCPSREKAQRAILAGEIFVNGQRARKASDRVGSADRIALAAPERFVSRGGQKLERALEAFRIDPRGWTALDLGASTGGFTDCLLQRGAAKVFAVDVGQGQLAWNLRRDPRVVPMERTNARHLRPQSFPTLFDLIVADCSFISLKKILPAARALLRGDGTMIALVKPQFEAGKREAAKGKGVITDPAIHQRVLAELREFAEKEAGLKWMGVVESPLTGPAGNKEFLVLLEKESLKDRAHRDRGQLP